MCAKRCKKLIHLKMALDSFILFLWKDLNKINRMKKNTKNLLISVKNEFPFIQIRQLKESSFTALRRTNRLFSVRLLVPRKVPQKEWERKMGSFLPAFTAPPLKQWPVYSSKYHRKLSIVTEILCVIVLGSCGRLGGFISRFRP